MEQLVKLIVDESKWLPLAMSLAFVATIVLLTKYRKSELHRRTVIVAALNLFFSITLVTMAFGHCAAVTTKLAAGSLQGLPLKLYAIGIALLLPAVWLVLHTREILNPHSGHGTKTVLLNSWIAITLLVLGIHNLPLAAPAALNIGYQLHSHSLVGWTMVSLAVLLNLGLFIGAIIFLLSGQSFEQFSGMG